MILSAFTPCRTVTTMKENIRLNVSDDGVANLLVRDGEDVEGEEFEDKTDATYFAKRWRRIAMLRWGTLFRNVRYCASLLSCGHIAVRYETPKLRLIAYH